SPVASLRARAARKSLQIPQGASQILQCTAEPLPMRFASTSGERRFFELDRAGYAGGTFFAANLGPHPSNKARYEHEQTTRPEPLRTRAPLSTRRNAGRVLRSRGRDGSKEREPRDVGCRRARAVREGSAYRRLSQPDEDSGRILIPTSISISDRGDLDEAALVPANPERGAGIFDRFLADVVACAVVDLLIRALVDAEREQQPAAGL